MSEILMKNDEYASFIKSVKQDIQSAQIKASLSVNKALLNLYWDLAKQIMVKEKQFSWGNAFIKQTSMDLQREFPNMKGFSLRNLYYIKRWYAFWSDSSEIVQQLVAQIPWGHNLGVKNLQYKF
jgi:predicted nuclease of restriction endonuclease-like (RecB) superfamily